MTDFVNVLRSMGEFEILLDPASREAWYARVETWFREHPRSELRKRLKCHSTISTSWLSLINGARGACWPAAAERRSPKHWFGPVRSEIVTGGASADSATYTAEIRSRYETDLSFQVAGKLVNRAVDVGATVKKGQLLAQLDQTDQQLGVDAARGAVPAAQSDLDRSRSEEARFRDLLERGLTTRAQYQAQQTAVRSAEAKLSQATAELRLAQQRLGYTTLRAGEDGVVTRVMVEVGTVVAAGQRALSIARPSELEAVFDVPDGRIGEVKAGSSVLINPLSGEATRGPAACARSARAPIPSRVPTRCAPRS